MVRTALVSKPGALHFGEDFLDVLGDRFLLFLETLDAFDEGPQLPGGDCLGRFAGDVFGQGSSPGNGGRDSG
jgi:hypothetical protein